MGPILSALSAFSSLSGTLAAAPADRMQAALASAVQRGAVPVTAQTALSGALGDVAGGLQAAPPAIGTDPSTMQARVNGLVDQEVTDGRLTTGQATELKQLFAANAPAGAVSQFGGSDGATTFGAAPGAGAGLDGTLQSVVDFARNLRLAIKGTGAYAYTGASAVTPAPTGMLVSGLA